MAPRRKQFHPRVPKPPRKPVHPKVKAGGAVGISAALVVSVAAALGYDIPDGLAVVIATALTVAAGYLKSA